MGGRRGERGRRGGVDPYIMLLFMQILQQVERLPDKPPVTIGLIVLQAWLHVAPLGPLDKDLEDVCMDPYRIVFQGEVSRLLLSTLYHVTDLHLYYNLSSFVLKGYLMERRYGSANFLAMILFFAVASSAAYVGLAFGSYFVLGSEGLLFSKAAGFSGVLFALKVVMHYNDEGEANVVGIQMPNKYVYWAELLLIQVMVPNASFAGHLSGILAGLAFVNMEAMAGRRDFLLPTGDWKRMFENFFYSGRPRRSYSYRRGATGGRGGNRPYERHYAQDNRTGSKAGHRERWQAWDDERHAQQFR